MVLSTAHAATREELVPKMPQPYPILVEALAQIAASNDSSQISEIARQAARKILSDDAIALIETQGLEVVGAQSAPLTAISAIPSGSYASDLAGLSLMPKVNHPALLGGAGMIPNPQSFSRTLRHGADNLHTEEPDGDLAKAIAEILAAQTLARAASAAISRCGVFAELAIATTRLKLERDEVRHRLKNVYASAIGLANLSLPREHSTEYAYRLRALAKVHHFLDDDGDRRMVVSLHALLTAVLAPYQDPDVPRIVVQGPDIEVAGNVATALGLLANELATNALKHGALSGCSGRVMVQWTHCDGEIGLWWRETGGPKTDTLAEPNEGSKLMRMLVERQLQGKMVHSLTGTGLHFAVLFPTT